MLSLVFLEAQLGLSWRQVTFLAEKVLTFNIPQEKIDYDESDRKNIF